VREEKRRWRREEGDEEMVKGPQMEESTAQSGSIRDLTAHKELGGSESFRDGSKTTENRSETTQTAVKRL
jgi:hypothetical protein